MHTQKTLQAQNCFLNKVFLCTKFDLRLEKLFEKFRRKYLGKMFCVAIKKKASHTISIDGNGMTIIFFSKTKTSVFSLPDCFIRIKQLQKLVSIFF